MIKSPRIQVYLDPLELESSAFRQIHLLKPTAGSESPDLGEQLVKDLLNFVKRGYFA